MSKQRDSGKNLKWYYSRCLLESPWILYLMNANKLLGETWDFFNASNSILSKSWYGTSSIFLAIVGFAVRLCMVGPSQTCSLELIWLCCRSRRDMTILTEHRRNEDASALRAGPRRAWSFGLDANTAAEGAGSEIGEKQLWAGARHEELQHFEDQCGKNYETHHCWLHNWGLSKRSGVAAVVNTVLTWILIPYCFLTLQCLCTARVAV